jgi:hypothetical protein
VSRTITLLSENFYELFFTLGMKKECCGLFFLCYCLGMERNNYTDAVQMMETFMSATKADIAKRHGEKLVDACIVGHLEGFLIGMATFVPEAKAHIADRIKQLQERE